MICLPVNTCALNCAVILDSNSNKESAAFTISVKLEPTFAASIAALANPFAPSIENLANASAFEDISLNTLPVATFADFAILAAVCAILVATLKDEPVKSIITLLNETISLPLVPVFSAKRSTLAAFAAVTFSNEPNSSAILPNVVLRFVDDNPRALNFNSCAFNGIKSF